MLELLIALPLLNVPVFQEAEFVVEPLDSPAATRSAFPNLARGGDGRVYLSWVERGDDDLGVMMLSVLGESEWEDPVEVTRGTDLFLNWADFPSVCALKSGVLIAHWLRQGKGEDSHGYMAEFSVSPDGGKSWSDPKKLHDDLSDVEHGFVSMVAIDSETFGAIWLDARASAGKDHSEYQTALYFRTISAKGELGSETVLDSRVCDCCQTSLVATLSGELIATYRDRSAKEVRDISLVRFDGKQWSEPKLVHADEWLIDGCPVNGPRVVSENGVTAVTWFTGMGGGGGSVRLAFREDDWYGAPIDIDEGKPVGRVDLVFPTKDSALVSWMEYASAGQANWCVRSVSREGKPGEVIELAEVPSDRASGYLRMVASNGDVILAWTTSDPGRRVETARLRAAK